MLEVEGETKSVAQHLRSTGVEPGPDVRDRIPVLAVGSNQSPGHLARKFAQLGGDVVIPVSRCRLEHFDSVYAFHFTQYGSIPATVQHAPGCVVTLAVTWLTPDQLAVMHPTEIAASNYAYVHMRGIRLTLDGGARLSEVYCYLGRHGCLERDGRPLAVAEVSAVGRCFPALRQSEVLALARERIAPEAALNNFLLEIIEDRDLRRSRVESLRRHCLRFAWPDYDVIAA